MICEIVGLFCPQVDAYYYPNRNDLSEFIFEADVGSVEGCQNWVYDIATDHSDPSMVRGDYECGIDPTGDMFGGMTVYKETVK